jgi:hypothetical protein
VSYDQLGQHAQEIQALAYEIALQDQDRGGVVAESSSPQATAELLFGHIPDLFTPFMMMPSPALFEAPLGSLGWALQAITRGAERSSSQGQEEQPYFVGAVLERMTDAQAHLSTWTGAAAEEFVRSFVVPFPSLNENQFILLYALQEALKAQQAVWTRAQRDIDSIAEQTIKALEALEGWCPARNDWPISLTVAACLIALPSSAIPGLGPGAILAFQFLSTAAWVAAADPPEQGTQLQIVGSTVPDVISSMTDAVSKLTHEVTAQQNAITTNLRSTMTALHTQSAMVTYDHTPDLLNLPPTDRTGPDGLGYAR